MKLLKSLKEFQNYTNVYDEDDAKQLIYVDAAENIVESYLGYCPLSQTYTIKFDGNGNNKVSLYKKNITNVASVLIDNIEKKDSSEYADSNTDELLYCSTPFTKGHKNIVVTFTAGWTVDDMPAEIKMTVLRIAALLQTESDGNIGVTSKSFDSGTSRTFIQTRNYDDYLIQCSNYKVIGY